jgi:hypothetical protein
MLAKFKHDSEVLKAETEKNIEDGVKAYKLQVRVCQIQYHIYIYIPIFVSLRRSLYISLNLSISRHHAHVCVRCVIVRMIC